MEFGLVQAQAGSKQGNGLGTAKGTAGSVMHHMAMGGTMIANQPTNVQFGENGLEMATFTPIKGGASNSMISNLSGGSNGGGISIELLLSPDLESRIVKNTLGKTAEIFTKVQRSK